MVIVIAVVALTVVVGVVVVVRTLSGSVAKAALCAASKCFCNFLRPLPFLFLLLEWVISSPLLRAEAIDGLPLANLFRVHVLELTLIFVRGQAYIRYPLLEKVLVWS